MKKVTAVGIGPGDASQRTGEAAAAVSAGDVVVGYTKYIDLLKGEFPEKEYRTTPMRQEKERCRIALEEAEKGRNTVLVCSGDAGIYGMASLLYEIGEAYPSVEIEVVSGVTAALSGAAVLGAPLGHDLCMISLSDLLTPWEKIEKRLLCAAEGDFVICLYNPASKSRTDSLRNACQVLLKKKPGDTVCGLVKNIAREGQESRILSLLELQDTPVDMTTTVFIGNRETKVIRGKMVTPRGYEDEDK